MTLIINELPPGENEIWLPWWQWEEVKSNMWGSVSNRKEWLKKAIEFTGDADLYGFWMMQVVKNWPNSCAHNLTKSGDKRPWMGHAAVALAIKCPEDVVRLAWGHLTKDQQNRANAKALEAINFWKEHYAKAWIRN